MVRESWMNDNGLNNVMDQIKRQKWEKLFKRRELVHVDAVKEFYARLTMSHNRKKYVARSSVRGVKIKFDHMKLASILGIPGNNGICEYIKEVWEKSRRRDDKIEAPAEEAEEEVEAQNSSFDWEVVVDEAAVQGESGSDDLFFDAQVDVEEPVIEAPAFPASPGDSTTQQKEPESVMIRLQADFERARANRIQADLEKAQPKNARLLALLQQAQSKPKP
ncbi:hypothetical protein Dimus_023151 [Dionaea muscipula]